MSAGKAIKISLIVPVYGVEDYIEQFACSALSQPYPNIEYIFVDDGTKDRSIELLEKLIDERFSYRRHQIRIVHKENGGLPAARRTGVECATGDYIYNVDPDDWLAEDAIAKIVERIEATEADIVYFNYVKEYPTRSKRKCDPVFGSEDKDKYIRAMYSHRAAASLCNKCIKRSLYTEHDLFTPRYGYAEDCCVTTQLVGYANSIAYLNEDVYHYRKGNTRAMTSQRIKTRKREYIQNVLDLYEYYRHRSNESSSEGNPIAPICDDIVIQAGWYSILYGLGLYESRPYLAEAIRKARVCRGGNVWLLFQWIVKLYTVLYLKLGFRRKTSV